MKRNLARRAVRKAKRTIKNLYNKKGEEIKVLDGKRSYIGKFPVLKVSEACELLDIRVPKSYLKYRNYYITDTPFFLKKMMNDKDFKLKVKIKEKISEQYYEHSPRRVMNGKDFRERYDKTVKLKQDDEEMLLYFIHWYCVFLPMKHKYSIGNYFDYELYNKTIAEAKEFAGRGYLNYLSNVLVIPEYRKYLIRKSLFNKTFTKYVNRDFLYVATAEFKDFDRFVSKNPRFFAKPVTGMKGKGIEVIEVDNNTKELFERLYNDKFIVESIVKQHPEIAAFNPDTLNTLRLTTFLPFDGSPLVTFAGIRFGRKGSLIDNVSTGGITASVDVETGKIATTGIDRDGNRFSKHPDSGKEFVGFTIPSWEKVLVAVKESAMALPQVRRIGWDVAVTQEGEVEFIEGNSKPAFRIAQISDQVGKKHLYEHHVQVLVDGDWKSNPKMREKVKGVRRK